MSDTAVLGILVPAWDEEGAVGAVVADALAVCRNAGLDAECLVCVDSRTTDRTAETARRAGAQVVTQHGRGLTDAVLQAAASARGAVCVVLDGDGQHDARRIVDLAAPVLAGEADVVVGARDFRSLREGFAAGRGGALRGALRCAGARCFARLARLALRSDTADPLSGMFACRRADLLDLRPAAGIAPPGGYKVLVGLLAATPPGRVRHRTIPFRPRRSGRSKLGARVVCCALRQLLALLLTRRPPARG